jgi:hypothetical protein
MLDHAPGVAPLIESAAYRTRPTAHDVSPPAAPDVTDENYSLRLVAALSSLWSAIRVRHPQVPPVVLLPAPSSSRSYNVLGHFAPLRWRAPRSGEGKQLHEVVVVAEHLNRKAEDILETLIHEAAHAMNFARGIRDCSKSQYHNAKFKAAAEELGLEVQRMDHYGWALTTLGKGTADRYQAGVAELLAVLIHRRRAVMVTPVGGDTPTTSDGEDRPRGRLLKATCKCGHIIRLSRKTIESTEIRCQSCGEPFELAE